MRRRHAAVTALTVLLPILPAASHAAGPPRSRDVLLITIDTLRYDATGFSGAGKVATPVFDRLAEAGTVFTWAHAHAVMTLPSHGSILTGLYPYQHGLRDNAGFVLSSGIPTLASRLKVAGYATAAFVSAFPLDRRFGLSAGFDVYDDEFEGYSSRISTLAERPAEATIARAKRWWDGMSAKPRFLWVHLFEPHFPYEPKEPFAARYAKTPYYGEAAVADDRLGALVDPILREGGDRVVVVFTSDHGEGLGDHGEPTHGIFAYEATLRIPLVIAAPGRIAPGRNALPARHVDIVPTVLDLLGLPVPGELPGRSLAAKSPRTGSDDSYFEALAGWLNRGWAPLHGILAGRRKAIDLPIPELYDLGKDPREENNRAGADPSRLRDLLSGIPADARRETPRSALDADLVEKLRSLGYAASPTPSRPMPDAASDPKRLIGLEREVQDAEAAYHRGKPAEAIAKLEALIARYPRMRYVYGHLAFMYADQDRPADYVALLSRAVTEGIADEAMKSRLAIGLLQGGKPQSGQEVLAGCRDSGDPETQRVLGVLAAALGETEAARRHLARSIEIDPTYPTARVDLAVLSIREGRLDEAQALLDEALRQNPNHPDGWSALGSLRARSGDLRPAIEAWDRALRLNPKLLPALLNLVTAARQLGETRIATDALDRSIPRLSGEARRKAEAAREALRPPER
jgi:arylsulfatase A-like enzyme